VADAATTICQRVDPVHRPHDGVPKVGVVDEQIRLGDLDDAQLDRVLADGLIEIVVPTAHGPEISIRALSPFQSGHVATSNQTCRIASREAVVSMLCSVAHATRLPRLGPLQAHPAG
jgi:hypothetical protein